MSARNGSKLALLERPQLGLEVGDPPPGRGEFAGAVLELAFEQGQAVGGVPQGADLLAQLVDLGGPAGLVVFLTVLGELGAFEGGGESAWRSEEGGGSSAATAGGEGAALWGGGGVEQAIEAGDAAGRAVAGFQFLAQTGAGEDGVLTAQLVDQAEDRGVGQAGRARHA